MTGLRLIFAYPEKQKLVFFTREKSMLKRNYPAPMIDAAGADHGAARGRQAVAVARKPTMPSLPMI